MTRHARPIIFALAVAAGSVHAQGTGDPGWTRDVVPPPVSREDRWKRAIANRIADANAGYKAVRAQAGTAEHLALFSLSRRIDFDALTTLLSRCQGQLIQIHRTVGELQMAFSASGPEFSRELQSALERRLASKKAAMVEFADKPEQLRWLSQDVEQASSALEELRASGARLNGFLVRGSFVVLDCLRSDGGDLILAVEMAMGSARRFAIPLEISK